VTIRWNYAEDMYLHSPTREFYRLASLREPFVDLFEPVVHPHIHQRLHLLDVGKAILLTLHISIEIDDLTHFQVLRDPKLDRGRNRHLNS